MKISQKELSEFGKKCYQIRERRELSVQFVSNKTGISRSTISRMEIGEQSVSFRAAIEVAKFYKISIDDLMELKL